MNADSYQGSNLVHGQKKELLASNKLSFPSHQDYSFPHSEVSFKIVHEKIFAKLF